MERPHTERKNESGQQSGSGVTAMTGMETAEIIKGVVEQTAPDVVLVVDALAARSTKRLNRTIQISDTGSIPAPAWEITETPLPERAWGSP